MRKFDLFILAAKNLWRRKIRTILTALGVLIGTSAIILMVSLGFGMEKNQRDMISQYGSITMLSVRKSWDAEIRGKKAAVLDDKAISTIKKMPHVVAVSPFVGASGALLNGKKVLYAQFMGVDPSTMENFDFKIGEGRLLNEDDKLTVVLGYHAARSFRNPRSRDWGDQPPIDMEKDRIKLSMDEALAWGWGTEQGRDNDTPRRAYRKYNVHVAGILDEKDRDNDYSVFIPMEQLNKLIKEKKKTEKSMGDSYPRFREREEKGYETVKVKVDEIENVLAIRDAIKAMGFEVYGNIEFLESTKGQTQLMQIVFGAVGAVALLVAAIGITNTMIMSIYERTKEIGVMKVIGASIGDIKQMFLLESALIGLIGGIIGVAFSLLAQHLLNTYGVEFVTKILNQGKDEMDMMFDPTSQVSTISLIPNWLLGVAVIFSAVIGVLAGYFPARRAMKLSALEAIRSE